CDARFPHQSDLRRVVGNHAAVHRARSRGSSLQAGISNRRARVVLRTTREGRGQISAVLCNVVPITLVAARDDVRGVRIAREALALRRASDTQARTLSFSRDGPIRSAPRAQANGGL